MKPDEVKAARAKLGMSHAQFAELVGVSARTVMEWEAGGRIGPTSWQGVLIFSFTVSPRAREIARVLDSAGLGAAYALGLEAALVRARDHFSAELAAERSPQVPVLKAAGSAEASR